MLKPTFSKRGVNRREFILSATGSAAAGSLAASSSLFAMERDMGALNPESAVAIPSRSLAVDRHRFGVNYTPSKNWWFCWNNWDADPIKRDLDAIAALGADHLRILLIWPYFQPNPRWVSPLHLERLDQLLTLMGQRN